MFTATHLHAMVIHFPIALLIVGFLSELSGLILKKEFFKKSAFYLLILGSLGIITAYFTGNAAGEGIEEGALKNAIELHEQAAVISLWLAVITAISYLVIIITKYPKAWARIVSLLIFTALIVSLARTGYLGGQLVYKHGAGVELSLSEF